MLINPLSTVDTLSQRQEQDSLRDPLDALRDAETLRTLLQHLRPYLTGSAPDVALRDIMRHLVDIVANPGTSYLLLSRIRADLASHDLDTVLSNAQQLVILNARRADEVLKPPC